MPTITPSRQVSDRWHGTPTPDCKFTVQQMRVSRSLQGQIAENRAQYGLPEAHDAIAVGRPVAHGEAAPSRRIPCPVVRSNRERDQLQVITPSGELAWITWRK